MTGRSRTSCFAARSFSLAEAVVSSVIVAVMVVAALNTVGASRVGQRQMANRAQGVLLAQDLMIEILQQAYEDSAFGPGSFGLGADEVGDGSRALWEDVDDYDGWSASPPQQKDGTTLQGFDGWQRTVNVAWADPASLNTDVGYNSLIKRIDVTASYNGAEIVTLTAVRASTDG